jgi:hypothetical protein
MPLIKRPKPTAVVLGLLCVMYLITYVDRVNISTAADSIKIGSIVRAGDKPLYWFAMPVYEDQRLLGVVAVVCDASEIEAQSNRILRDRIAQLLVKNKWPLLDVTSGASIQEAFRAVAAVGPVDVLVNNAGIGGATPLEMTPEDEHRTIFETNYFGAVRCIQAVLPAMRERKSGAIVNVTSVSGLIAMPNQVAYSASKWALECAGEALAHADAVPVIPTTELVYAPDTYYLFHSQLPHAVVNFAGPRVLLSLEFAEDAAALSYAQLCGACVTLGLVAVGP